MLTDIREILNKAKEGSYAVGAFNTVNLEITRAIMEAAREMRSPLVIQITEKTMDYAGGRVIYKLVKDTMEFYAPEVPFAIHLDHGKSFEVAQRAVEIGFNSVMYDGSRKNFADNVSMTKKVVEYAHEKGVAVQGELGSVPYLGEAELRDIKWEDYMTDPGQAEEFVKETGIDSLAVAIGNAHGFFKEKAEPDYARLEMIHKIVGVPLILHGASDWENERVKRVVERGVCCFNVDTATRMSFINNLIKTVKDRDGLNFDVRKILGSAKEEVKRTVMQKMKFFGSDGKI